MTDEAKQLAAKRRLQWAKDNRGSRNASVQKWRANNRERVRANDRDYYSRRKVEVAAAGKKYRLKKNYALTPDQVQEMLNSQGRCCALCGTDDPGKHPGWVVDHCHRTKMVRGILCSSCNLALRKGRDTIEYLEKALAYIKRSSLQELTSGVIK